MKPDRKTGVSHIMAAAGYSLQGLRRLSRETAFRHEALIAAGLVAGMGVVGAGLVSVTLGVALLIGVFAAEAMNTAIEEVVDHVSPDFSVAAGHAKDLGSLTVGLSIIAAYGYCLVVIVSGLLA